MTTEIGEAREAWGWDVWNKAQAYANEIKERDEFYIVFAAKPDKGYKATFRQAFRFYKQRPPRILGILVWKVDHAKGLFEFVPELSAPPDMPLDPSLLSTRPEDYSASVAESGSKTGVVLS